MPYKTEWTENGVWWTYSGIVTSKEALQSNLEIYGDSRFDRLTYQIADFSGAEALELTEGEVKKIAYLDRAAALSNPKIKVAIVAHLDLIKEMAQMYANYSETSPWQTKIFNTLQEARQWLQI